MWTRRSGAACETAQNSVAVLAASPAGTTLIVRFDSERQKLSSAVQLPPEHWLSTLITPLMVTSPGFSPRPATVV